MMRWPDLVGLSFSGSKEMGDEDHGMGERCELRAESSAMALMAAN